MIDDDEAYGLHCDIGRLEQENARLRELIYDRAHDHAIQHMTEDELRITLANALDENAKLRELCADMWPHVRYRLSMCASCELPCDASDECLLYEPMRRRMRDLGIEVD